MPRTPSCGGIMTTSGPCRTAALGVSASQPSTPVAIASSRTSQRKRMILRVYPGGARVAESDGSGPFGILSGLGLRPVFFLIYELASDGGAPSPAKSEWLALRRVCMQELQLPTRHDWSASENAY